MVDYITREELRGLSGTTQERSSVVRKAEERSPVGATFLSHSSKDTDILPGVIVILERHGAVVYVDKKDETLPPTTSRETAAVLRHRVQQCRKFILLATPNSKDSRWMPWELGLADGHKGPSNTTIFPSPDRVYEKGWSEEEYLGIYDRIVYGQLEGRQRPVFMVWNQVKNTAMELSEWLRS